MATIIPSTNTGRAEFFGTHTADAARAGHVEIAVGCARLAAKFALIYLRNVETLVVGQ